MKNGGNERAFEPERETEVDPVAVVAASCRRATARLPRGRLGAATAEKVARGLAAAVSRRLPDITGSPTEVFAALVGRQVLGEMPCPRVRGPALRLLAQVTPLVAPNGSRRWNLWLETALDPRSDIFSKVRSSTPCLRDSAEAEERRGPALFEERETLYARLADAVTLQRSISELTRERDRLRADLLASRHELRAIYRRIRDEIDPFSPEPSTLESAWRIIEKNIRRLTKAMEDESDPRMRP